VHTGTYIGYNVQIHFQIGILVGEFRQQLRRILDLYQYKLDRDVGAHKLQTRVGLHQDQLFETAAVPDIIVKKLAVSGEDEEKAIIGP